MLVICVIFVFLRSLAATFIAGVAVPLSLVGTCAAMYLFGFSINNLTLMALTISTGFVVDDAIVMIENIVRYIEMGEKPMEAALKGAGQIGFTIVALTISLIAVLIPLLFMQDIVGRLFREFAITLSFTILISALVSLTLTPMLAARLLKRRRTSTTRPLYQLSGGRVSTASSILRRDPARRSRHPAARAARRAGHAGPHPLSSTPSFRRASSRCRTRVIIQGISEADQNISFPPWPTGSSRLANAILKDPAVASISSFIGVDGTNTTLNNGRIQINLKPLDQRNISASAKSCALQGETRGGLRHHALHAAGAGPDRG